MRSWLVTVFGSLLLATASATMLDYKLIRSDYPTEQQVVNKELYPNCSIVGTIGNETNINAWTQMVWVRCISNQWDYTANRSAQASSTMGSTAFRPFVMQFFSVRPGCSTAEGGPTLKNEEPWDYDTPLTFSADGQWSYLNALPACDKYVIDEQDIKGNWQYGCYAFNIETDTDLTISVGGEDRNVEADLGKQSFNILCKTSSRDICITCADTNAVVKLGFATNPMVQFFGHTMTSLDAHGNSWGINPQEGYCGITTNEWTLLISRARINPDRTLTYRMNASMYDYYYDGEQKTETPSQPITSDYFHPWARCAFTFASFDPTNNLNFYTYGHKIFKGWLDDDMIKIIRDKDTEMMKNIGIFQKRVYGNGWDAELNTTNWLDNASSVTNLMKTFTHAGTGDIGEVYRDHRDIKGIINVKFTSSVYTADQFKIECPGSVKVDGTQIHVTSNGSYQVHITDPNGLTVTLYTSIYNIYTDRYWCQWKAYGNSVGSRWIKYLNKRVTDVIKDVKYNCRARTYSYATSTGAVSFISWRFKRCPVTPSKTHNNVGWARPHAVTPHVWASAAHYGGLAASGNQECVYTSEDGTKTSKVKVNTSTRTNLYTWAKSERDTYGFTDADLAATADICVGTYFQDLEGYDNYVDPDMCPYVVDLDEFEKVFGCLSNRSCFAWAEYQYDKGYVLPVRVHDIFNVEVRNDKSYTVRKAFDGWAPSQYLDPESYLAQGYKSGDNYSFYADRTANFRRNRYNSVTKDMTEAEFVDYVSGATGHPYGGLFRVLATEDWGVMAETIEKFRDTVAPNGWEFPPIYVGDSGLAGYLNPEDGVWLINIHNTQVGLGPNYHAARKVLDAYASQFDKNEKMKVYTFPAEPPDGE